MAIVTIPDEHRTVTEAQEIRTFLATIGIDYEQWQPAHEVAADADAEEILDAYKEEIDKLKAAGGYVTADVVNITPQMPGLDELLAKFNREHWHDEDEVRFILRGRGLFHIHPPDHPVVGIEVVGGDLIRVPRGTRHWFNLCSEREIRAIRLFQDVSGWTPQYTESGVDAGYQPTCFGATYLPPLSQTF